jgi:hypothetical protein
MVVIVPTPDARPLHLVAATVYPKNATGQLSAKQLARILAKVTGADAPILYDLPPDRFRRVVRIDKVFVSVCLECGETVGESSDPRELAIGEERHECTGPI